MENTLPQRENRTRITRMRQIDTDKDNFGIKKKEFTAEDTEVMGWIFL